MNTRSDQFDHWLCGEGSRPSDLPTQTAKQDSENREDANVCDVFGVRLADIDRFAELLLKHLPAEMAIGLVGTLGAGKTRLVQAIAKAAGVDAHDVTSPTFTLLQSYAGTLTLHHVDAYRLADENEFLELGVEELFENHRSWTIVEWADRVRHSMPKGTLWIRITIPDQTDQRDVSLFDDSGGITAKLRQFKTAFEARKSSMEDNVI